jgi:hypothetical protein
MKPPTRVCLMTFEANSFEVSALSGLLLLYLGHVYRLERPSCDELLMAQTLHGFYARLVEQLPSGRTV